MAILGQVLATGTAPGGAGSYAQARVHDLVRRDILEADCKAVEAMINSDLIRPLVLFNFGADAPRPAFKLMCDPPEDEAALLSKYTTLIVDLGYPVSVEHLEEKFNVPPARDGETALTPPRSGQPPVMASRAAGSEARDAGAAADPRDLLDALAKELAAEAGLDLSAVERLVAGAKSADEIEAKLFGLYPEIDRNRLATALHKAWFAAQMMGRMSVKEEVNRGDRGGRGGSR
jgi:phage gp29-like protein